MFDCALASTQGYLAHKKQPPPYDHRRALHIALLLGPRSVLFQQLWLGRCALPGGMGEEGLAFSLRELGLIVCPSPASPARSTPPRRVSLSLHSLTPTP